MALKEIVAKLAKKGAKSAEEILAKIGTAEEAVKLKGAERAEYLKALDEVHGPRADRAAKMGFDGPTYYHGTKGDITKFDNAKLGSSTGAPSAQKAHFFTDNTDVASQYANFADNPDYLQKAESARQKMLVEAAKPGADQKKLVKEYEKTLSDVYDANGKILPVKIKSAGQEVVDFGGKPYREKSYADILDKAKSEGKSSVLLKNTYDNPMIGEVPAHNVLAETNPKNIRSVNANYDPRFADSDLIMSAKQSAPKSTVDKVLSGLSYLQRKGMKAGAEALGVKGDDENSEASAQAIVENLAKRAGIPEDSNVGNAAKALGVAGLEVFADPLSVVPVGKVAKLIGKAKNAGVAAKIIEKFPKAAQALNIADEAPKALKGLENFETAQKVADKAVKSTRAQEIAKSIGVIKGNADADLLKIKPENIAKKKVKEGATPIPYTHLVPSRR